MQQKIDIIITAKDQASNVLQGLGGIARGVLKLGVAAAAVGFTALTTGVAFAVKEAMEAQEVFAQTEAVIKSTGGVAGITAQEAAGLAESLSEVTRFSDETVLAGENILLTFTNIGEDVFPDATGVMLDMSQALGQDLQSSAIQLGKALQDPVQGITALRRVGVNFTDEQQKMIEGLVEAGKLEEAQTMILKELQTEFGGSAEAAGQTFAGQLDILRNKVSNVAEGIGTKLLPIGMKLVDKFLVPALPFIEAFAERIGELVDIFISAETPLEGVRMLLAELFPPSVLAGFDFVVAKFNEIKTAILEFVNTTLIPFVREHGQDIKAVLVGIVAGLSAFVIISQVVGWIAGLVAAIGAISGAITTAGGLIGGLVAILGGPVTIVIAALAGLVALFAAAWVGNWGGIQEKTRAVIDFLKPYIEGFITGIKDWWAANGEQIIATAQGIWDGIVAGFEFFKGLFMGIVSAFQSAFAGDWYTFGEKLRVVWDTLWAKIKEIVTKAIENVKAAFKKVDWGAVGKGIIQGIVSGIKSAVKILVDAAIAAAKAAIDAVKGFLGVHSPSQVFMEIGENMMAGMAKGIQLSAVQPRNAAMGASAGVAYGTAKSGGMGGGGFYIGEINIFPPEGADAAQVAELVLVKLSQAMSGGASMMYAE